jgi:hypothetical protein
MVWYGIVQYMYANQTNKRAAFIYINHKYFLYFIKQSGEFQSG